MHKQEDLFNTGKTGRIEQDQARLFREFERDIIGIIRKGKGSISSKSQKEIREIIDAYEKRWTNE